MIGCLLQLTPSRTDIMISVSLCAKGADVGIWKLLFTKEEQEEEQKSTNMTEVFCGIYYFQNDEGQLNTKL